MVSLKMTPVLSWLQPMIWLKLLDDEMEDLYGPMGPAVRGKDLSVAGEERGRGVGRASAAGWGL